MKTEPKINDVIFYEDNLRDKYFLYVIKSTSWKYYMAKVNKTHCCGIDLTYGEFERFTKTVLVDNIVIPEMEIMNLTDKYPEYLV